MELQSDLWLDQPDAHERIEERLARGSVSAEEAALLHVFVDDGYLKFAIDLDEEFARGFDDEVSRIWEERPDDLAISAASTARPRSPTTTAGSATSGTGSPTSTVTRRTRSTSTSTRSCSGWSSSSTTSPRSRSSRCTSSTDRSRRCTATRCTSSPTRRRTCWRRGSRSKTSAPRAARSPTFRSRTDLPWFEFEPGHGGVRAEGPGREAGRVRGMETRRRSGTGRSKSRRSRAAAATRSSGTPVCCTAGSRIGDREQTRKSFVVHYCTAANYDVARREHARARGRRLAAGTSPHRQRDRTGRPGADSTTRCERRPRGGQRAAASTRRRAGGARGVPRGGGRRDSPAAVVGEQVVVLGRRLGLPRRAHGRESRRPVPLRTTSTG